jgi:hypothetical protein
VDRQQVGRKLKALRESRFPDRGEFVQIMKRYKVDYGAIQDVEESESPRYLRIDRLEGWVTECGSTLADFFASMAPVPDPKSTVQITVKRINKESHEKYEALLNCPDSSVAEVIRQNVITFHAHHVVSSKKRTQKKRTQQKESL